MEIQELIDKIAAYKFNCEAGSLLLCVDYQKLCIQALLNKQENQILIEELKEARAEMTRGGTRKGSGRPPTGEAPATEVILRCNAVNGKIDMCIGFKTLKFAAENHPYFWDGKSGMDVPNINITDAATFAKEVAHAINDEAEEGSTLLTRMLDEAIKNAVESGCDGVALDAQRKNNRPER